MSQSQEVIMKKGTTAPEVLYKNWYWKWPGEKCFVCLFVLETALRVVSFQNVDLDSTSSSMSPLLAAESSQPRKKENEKT